MYLFKIFYQILKYLSPVGSKENWGSFIGTRKGKRKVIPSIGKFLQVEEKIVVQIINAHVGEAPRCTCTWVDKFG